MAQTRELPYFQQCPGCQYNFVTGEGLARCGDPPSCDWAEQGYAHAENVRRLRSS